MIITTNTIIKEDTRRPNLPEGVSFNLLEDHGDAMTVKIKTDLSEQELVEAIPSYIPHRVDPGHLMVALLNFDEALFDQIESAIEEEKALRSAMRGAFVSRQSILLAQIADRFGITDKQLDNLFREAATLVL